MKKILVTGAGGYIGTEMVHQLLEAGHKVVGLDRYFFGEELLGKDILDNSRFSLLKKDIRKAEVEDFEGIDVVMDFAGLSNDPTSELNKGLTESINYHGNVNIAEKAKKAGVKQYIFSSSCSAYGEGGEQMLTETSDLRPVSLYAKTKALVEEDVFKMADSDFVVTALRNATAFGDSRRMRFDLAVNLMTLCAWRDGKIIIMGGGKQWRPFIHIKDICQAFSLVMNADKGIVQGEIFNVGDSDNNLQIVQLGYMIKSIFPGVDLITAPDDADRRSYHISFEKIEKAFGFKASISPLDGAQVIKDSLTKGKYDINDTRHNTLNYYKYLLDIERVFYNVADDGKIF